MAQKKSQKKIKAQKRMRMLGNIGKIEGQIRSENYQYLKSRKLT